MFVAGSEMLYLNHQRDPFRHNEQSSVLFYNNDLHWYGREIQYL